MAVVVQFDSEKSIQEVFKNIKKLNDVNIRIGRDMNPTQQQNKKASIQLKRKILEITKEHKVLVRGDKLKINDHWFSWNNEKTLMSGKTTGEEVLIKIYGDKIKAANLKYEETPNNISKN